MEDPGRKLKECGKEGSMVIEVRVFIPLATFLGCHVELIKLINQMLLLMTLCFPVKRSLPHRF